MDNVWCEKDELFVIKLFAKPFMCFCMLSMWIISLLSFLHLQYGCTALQTARGKRPQVALCVFVSMLNKFAAPPSHPPCGCEGHVPFFSTLLAFACMQRHLPHMLSLYFLSLLQSLNSFTALFFNYICIVPNKNTWGKTFSQWWPKFLMSWHSKSTKKKKKRIQSQWHRHSTAHSNPNPSL